MSIAPRVVGSASLALVLGWVAGCGTDSAPIVPIEDGSVEVRRCRPGEGASGSPRNIADALALVNSLPLPVTAECFVESLDRPLQIEASRSIFSAQPAVGTRSPRIFLFFDPLIITIVPDGDGRDLVEFGELVSDTRSLKGEIAFPVETRLGPEAPFEQVLFGDGALTNCAFCHAAEEPSSFAPKGYVSEAIRPLPHTLVPLEELRDAHATCDSTAEPRRCAYLDAIVAPGEFLHRSFPEAFATFGN